MTSVVSVRFRSGTKDYYFDPGELVISAGEDVIVDTAQGPEFARCTEGNHEVPDEAVVLPLRSVLRLATENDRRTADYNRGREREAFAICQKKIARHGLEMKLVRVECSFDGSKILFFFTADGRVDFRELVKDLAGVFRSRIELRQIGVRDEAKMLGGLGICGRPFCCSQFLDDFIPVSIKMAKTQSLSLNPTKISGTCGRLMCCLKYEQDAYEDALKHLPKPESFVVTPDGPGNVNDVNVLKETVNVRLDGRTEPPRCYHNCEVCVLRSGKGSREGIEVPARWPERYVEETEPDTLALPSMIAAFEGTGLSGEPQAPAPEEERPSRRRSRGGRGRRGGKPAGAETPKEAREPREAKEAKPSKPPKEKPPAPQKEGGKPAGGSHRRRRGAKPGGGQAAPAAPQTPAAPKPEHAPGAEAPRKRPRYRGRRRSGKPSSGGEQA